VNHRIPHITVCVCTYHRPALLRRLLEELDRQETHGAFTYSVVVVDNDGERSAEPVVREWAAVGRVAIDYCVEPEQNIALARNMALRHAQGEWIAFIDDDEYPIREWLTFLLETCEAHGSHAALGPVKPYFESDPPQWVRAGRFFDRPTHPTGRQLHWSQTRTGNVLFRREIVNGLQEPFRRELGTGSEDVDFFRRMAEKRCKFVWCNEAVAYELVPAFRCKRRYLLKRALLRGSNFPKRGVNRLKSAAKSVLAVPCYLLMLPVLAVMGEHLFLRYLIKLCDHTARLFAFVGLRLQTEREM
jgi:succinoglycan biosynthesis protein ExoM